MSLMKLPLRHFLFLAVTLGSWCGTAYALSAGDVAAIREKSDDAATEYDAGQYSAALEKFQLIYSVAKVPTFAVWLARTNEKLGRLVMASELYQEALMLQSNELWKGNKQQAAQKEAKAKVEQLRPRIPKLNIVIEGAPANDVVVTIDDTPVLNALLGLEHPVDPGTRQIVAKHGDDTQRESVTLAERDKKTVTIRFEMAEAPAVASPANTAATAPAIVSAPVATAASPAPASVGPSRAPIAPPMLARQNAAISPAVIRSFASTSTVTPKPPPAQDQGTSTSSSQRTLGWIGVGIGAAGLAVGAGAGVGVAGKYGELSTKCNNDRVCSRQYAYDLNTYNTLKTISTTGFIVGGVVTAVGVTILLTCPRKPSQPAVGVWLAPNTAEVKGEF